MFIARRVATFFFAAYALVIFGCAHFTVSAPSAPVKPVAEIIVEDSIINVPVSLPLNSLEDVAKGLLQMGKGSNRSNDEDASVGRIRRFLNRQITKLDDTVVNSDFIRERASAAWEALQYPIPLTDNLALLLNPQAVHVSPSSAQNEQGDEFTVVIGLVARPRIITNNTPHPSAPPVPHLSTAPSESSFHIALESELSYQFVGSELAKRLEGQVFTRGDNRIRIGNVKVFGSGESVILQLRVTGTINGTIYLKGTPAYDALSRRLYIRDLDYTVETRQVLVKAEDWMFHTRLRKSLEDAAKWDIGNRIDGLSGLLTKALNRKLTQHVAISGTIDTIRPVAVGLTDAALRAVLVLDGAAELHIF
ncbi:MAG TPA: DUF4403 family protein [Nitrospirota bacterium]|nr:DUF4403 family protein [Nitrospirota bacterium]